MTLYMNIIDKKKKMKKKKKLRVFCNLSEQYNRTTNKEEHVKRGSCMEELYTNNNEMLIKYIDSETGLCLTTQQTAIASVILQALTFCNYITINGIDYIMLEAKLALSKDALDKNVYEVYVENAANYMDDIGEEHFEEE